MNRNLSTFGPIFLLFIGVFTFLASVGAQLTDSQRITYLETEVSILRGTQERHALALGFVTATPTLSPTRTPTSTSTPTATRTVSVTSSPTRTPQGMPNTPTPESVVTLSATPTFFNATNTPTRTRTPSPIPGATLSPTADPYYYGNCAPTGDFVVNDGYEMNLRSGPGTSFARWLNSDGTPIKVTSERWQIVCAESLTFANGYEWIQRISNSRAEWFAISFTNAQGVKETYGVLRTWN